MPGIDTPTTIVTQLDFSAGEVDPSLKRGEGSPFYMKGLRQCSNYRILNSGKLSNRLGTSAQFQEAASCRVEEVSMAPGQVFRIIFGPGYLRVRNAAGAQVFFSTVKGDGTTAIPWTSATVAQIVYTRYQYVFWITYGDGAPNNVPQILTWDGISQTSTWTLTTFAELVTAGTKYTFFYRISPLGVTMTPSANTGTITIAFSQAIAFPGMVGTRMRFANQQMLITGYTDSTHMTALVEGKIPPTELLNLTISGTFNLGDIIVGNVSGTKGEIVALAGAAVTVQVLLGPGFVYGPPTDDIAGPTGAAYQNAPATLTAILPSLSWDEEIMNTYRGYPYACFYDQGRLGFCNFPSVPGGIGYSWVGVYNDFDIPVFGASANNGIFELVPGQGQVLYVIPAAENVEVIFCDNAIYYVPITQQAPLSATTGLTFNMLSADGCYPGVEPRRLQEAVVYVPAGGARVTAVSATGAYLRPFEVRHLSLNHDHLISLPVAICAPSGTDLDYPERYLYVLNADGTLAVGKFDISDGMLKEVPGWVLESRPSGIVNWVSARIGSGDVIFVTTYTVGSATVTMHESRDFTQYLDCAMPYNGLGPTQGALTPPGGQGPLWYLANGTVTVLDQGTRQMGTYQVDANGFLVPQFFGGEDLTSTQLVVGQPWTAIAEPFISRPNAGPDVGQRMFRQRIKRMFVNVAQSTGFLMQRLYAGPIKTGGPALGDVMNVRRVVTYNEGDDATQPAPQREATYLWRTLGREYDPRRTVVKDTPGPLIILEIGFEATV